MSTRTTAATEVNRDLVMAYAEIAALTVLDQAGRGLMRIKSRRYRGHRNGVDQVETWQRHTIIPTGDVDLDRLLAGAFRILDSVSLADECLRRAVETYVRIIIAAERPYSRDDLARVVDDAGCFDAAA